MANRRWTAEEVLEEIRSRENLSYDAVPRSLCRAAEKIFGTWGQALEAAGRPSPFRRPYEAEDVLEWIRRSPAPMYTRAPSGLAKAASRFFGSWPAALEAARSRGRSRELSDAKPLRRKFRLAGGEEVLDWIRHRESGPLPLSYKAARGERTEIVESARIWFGSWTGAVLEAGAPVERLGARVRWTPELAGRAVAQLRERGLGEAQAAELGLASLVSAVRRFFGTWEAAG